MGNLNCFTNRYGNQKNKWFDEWQNNSSYPYPYDYYERDYFQKSQMMNPQYQTNSQNSELMNYYYQQQLNNGFLPPNYAQDKSEFNPNMSNSVNNIKNHTEVEDDEMEIESESKDDAQEAFMTDWLAREEAELNLNVKTLQTKKGKKENPEIVEKQLDKSVVENSFSESKKSTKKHSKHRKHKHRKSRKHRRKKKESDNESSDSSSSESSSEENSSSDSEMIKLNDNNKDETKQDIVLGFSEKKNGKCCYTAYIMCNSSNEWDNFIKRTARFMTGLQRQFQCVIKFSDKIQFHRGNSVRQFQIIGPHKGSVIRCKAALPNAVTQLLITPLTGSVEVEEYTRECNYARIATSRRNLLQRINRKY